MTSSDALRVRLFPRALGDAARATIDAVLDRFPAHLIARLVDGGTQIVPLASGERYADASGALRRRHRRIDSLCRRKVAFFFDLTGREYRLP
jgi:hypothetical protein